MPHAKPALPLLLVAFLLTACLPSTLTPSPLSPGLTPSPLSTDPAPSSLTILYTSDEHGWMNGQENGQGAAELFGLLQAEYGLGQDPAVLLLSGGDNWTGQAISTWFDGVSMVEVMNRMGYSASALGNHEFDFGLEVLQSNLEMADFPYLGANIRWRADDRIPAELGIRPYTLVQAGKVKVGIIGLSGTNTPQVANPAYLEELNFTDYQAALSEFVPQMRAEGAQIILLISHLCPDELELLAWQAAELEIAMLGGGHCHIGYARQAGETAILTAPGELEGYGYVRLRWDPASGQTRVEELGVEDNLGGTPDQGVAELVATWQLATDEQLNGEIGWLLETIPEDSQAMQDLITESWLWAYPNANIALTNLGGMRTDLPAGMLSMASVVDVLPFNNTIIEVHLTGAQVIDTLSHGRDNLAIGGMHRQGGSWMVEKSGTPLDMKALYSVLVNDYMYAGGDGYTMLFEADPQAYQTGIDWRQPVIDWILAQESTPEDTLDAAIAALGD